MSIRKQTLVLALCSMLFDCCSDRKALREEEGFVAVTGGKIWYRVTGKGQEMPILLLHGGPGSPSYYLNPLKELGNDRKVITFDQLGCGRSDRITDTALINVDSYVEEIKTLVDHLGLREFYLYGHSWGSILAAEYYFKHPEGIKALILTSPILSVKRWSEDADMLISYLSDTISQVLRNDMRGIVQDSIHLHAAMDRYLMTYGARKRPLSPDFDSTFTQEAPIVMENLWGHSEFIPSGALRDYDRTEDLKKINVPVCYIIGEYDEVTYQTVKYYQSLTPHSIFKVIKGAGHMVMQDNPEDNRMVIAEFLSRWDKAQK